MVTLTNFGKMIQGRDGNDREVPETEIKRPAADEKITFDFKIEDIAAGKGLQLVNSNGTDTVTCGFGNPHNSSFDAILE
jgi:hypothetical protein